jgi:hypothetical protein
MTTVRIALANLRAPVSPTTRCVWRHQRSLRPVPGAIVVCFPECFVPGYRWPKLLNHVVETSVFVLATRPLPPRTRA